MTDIIERLKRGHQGSGVGPLDCHDALLEIEDSAALRAGDRRKHLSAGFRQRREPRLHDGYQHGAEGASQARSMVTMTLHEILTYIAIGLCVLVLIKKIREFAKR